MPPGLIRPKLIFENLSYISAAIFRVAYDRRPLANNFAFCICFLVAISIHNLTHVPQLQQVFGKVLRSTQWPSLLNAQGEILQCFIKNIHNATVSKIGNKLSV